MKGHVYNGVCARTDCNNSEADHWNPSTRAWYCLACACKIETHNPNLCSHADNLPIHPTEFEALRAELAAVTLQRDMWKRRLRLCPDCRDKVPEGTCPRCEWQTAERKLAAVTKDRDELKQFREWDRGLIGDANRAVEALRAELAALKAKPQAGEASEAVELWVGCVRGTALALADAVKGIFDAGTATEFNLRQADLSDALKRFRNAEDKYAALSALSPRQGEAEEHAKGALAVTVIAKFLMATDRGQVTGWHEAPAELRNQYRDLARRELRNNARLYDALSRPAAQRTEKGAE